MFSQLSDTPENQPDEASHAAPPSTFWGKTQVYLKQQQTQEKISQVFQWVRQSPWVFTLAILFPLLLGLRSITLFNSGLGIELEDYLERQLGMPVIDRWQDVFLAVWDWLGSLRNNYLLSLLPAFLIWADRRLRGGKSLITPMVLVSLLILLSWLPGELVRYLPALNPSQIGANDHSLPHWVYIFLVLGGLFSMPFLAWLMQRLPLLDRFTLKAFLSPFVLCLVIFLGIWHINDFSDNSAEFSQGDAKIGLIANYYFSQLPHTLTTLIPVASLLASLYTLSKLSRNNELTAMLGSGKSLGRIVLPIFAAALVFSMLSLVLNFRLAPHAMAQKKATLSAIADGEAEVRSKRFAFEDRIYVDAETNRLWFLGRFPANFTPSDQVRNTYIVQLDKQNRPLRAISAKRAKWHPENPEKGRPNYWRFNDSTVWERQSNGRFLLQEHGTGANAFYRFDSPESPWPENPYRLGTAGLRPADASVAEIYTYLRSTPNANPNERQRWLLSLHQLIANSFTGLVIALFAVPLAVSSSRRSVMGGVAASVVIFFAHLFLTNLLNSFGQAGSLHPALAAWGANLLMAAIGLYLLSCRQRNRDIPSITQLWKKS